MANGGAFSRSTNSTNSPVSVSISRIAEVKYLVVFCQCLIAPRLCLNMTYCSQEGQNSAVRGWGEVCACGRVGLVGGSQFTWG